MLTLVRTTANKKTGPIAATYRSGTHETYSTCPKSCRLHPKHEAGADQIDNDYLQALLKAVPRGGIAWTYSHFNAAALPTAKKGQTVINASCDSVHEAVDAVKQHKKPAVLAAPAGTVWPQTVDGVRFARCPAELSDNFTCAQCGNGSPLCARADREFVVVFVAHGAGAKKVGGPEQGGCYAASGPTAIAWHGVKKRGQANDGEALLEFVRTLPRGSMLRHHVAGDIGLES